MNIQEAKTQIKRAVTIYLAKDEYGEYRISVEKQRPIFLVGAPGIGKTAIMAQIAEELGISLVSYSMTHHTRQSALGLPFITHRSFQDQEYDVTNYTMSEIISTVYDTIQESGIKEGILFLDEINCVSETLAPSMLQFLQYKSFGKHRVPEGWVIVTAGNPTEYNRSAREFDVVTLDRLKVLEVSPDYEAWKYYAKKKDIHRAILTFLDIRKDDFYGVDNTSETKHYVTARGWEDLSETLKLYEEMDYPVDETLISQYIRSPRIAREFVTYYSLYEKYKADYQIPEILKGTEDRDIQERAKKAGFDERLTVTGLLLEALQPRIRKHMEKEAALKELLPYLREMKGSVHISVHDSLQNLKDQLERELEQKEAAGNLTTDHHRNYAYELNFIRKAWDALDQDRETDESHEKAFALVKKLYDTRVEEMQNEIPEISGALDHLFSFVERAYGDDNEMLVLVTELTVNPYSASYLTQYGCEGYYKYNQRLMVFERNKELMEEINRLKK